MTSISPRLQRIVDSLPIEPSSRVIEIGCGPGNAARAIAEVLSDRGHILATDRSQKVIDQLTRESSAEISSGVMSARCIAVEDLRLLPGEKRFDFAVANRVGALDGRHPELWAQATEALRKVLKPEGRLFVDGVEVPSSLRRNKLWPVPHNVARGKGNGAVATLREHQTALTRTNAVVLAGAKSNLAGQRERVNALTSLAM